MGGWNYTTERTFQQHYSLLGALEGLPKRRSYLGTNPQSWKLWRCYHAIWISIQMQRKGQSRQNKKDKKRINRGKSGR